jgi:hypothetical protein
MTDVELGPDRLTKKDGVVQEILPPLNTVAHDSVKLEISKDELAHGRQHLRHSDRIKRSPARCRSVLSLVGLLRLPAIRDAPTTPGGETTCVLWTYQSWWSSRSPAG